MAYGCLLWINRTRDDNSNGFIMSKVNPVTPNLIAPCGMNCAICSRYLAHVNNLRRSRCIGCRPRSKACSYLFKKCGGPPNNSEGHPAFCFECSRYPCERIDHMDKRYRTGYGVSMKENLEYIRKYGVARFTVQQYRKYRCTKCSGMISIHNRRCFRCERIIRLVEKLDPKKMNVGVR